jgi:hypothetical protein
VTPALSRRHPVTGAACFHRRNDRSRYGRPARACTYPVAPVLARVQPDDTAGSGSQNRARQITPEFEATVAQAVGPAILLLDRMDPVRVTINVGNAEVEEARWKELTQQVYAARERLLIIAAGHPRQDIRKLAEQAQVKLANVLQASGWAVSDLLRNRDNPEWMEHARKTHEEAKDALQELIDTTFT